MVLWLSNSHFPCVSPPFRPALHVGWGMSSSFKSGNPTIVRATQSQEKQITVLGCTRRCFIRHGRWRVRTMEPYFTRVGCEVRGHFGSSLHGASEEHALGVGQTTKGPRTASL
eukprot:9479118-Pyramimonas_sp.AAC.3